MLTTVHCWLEDVRNYKNKSPQNNYIFLIPLNIPDFAASIVFLIRVRLPGGAAIIFAQRRNFELKFFVDNLFMQKITFTCVGSHFLPKKCLEGPKAQIQKLYWCLEKDWKWPSKSIESTINCLHNVWMPQCSFGLANFRFLVSNVQYLDCNLLAVLAHFWTKSSFSHLYKWFLHKWIVHKKNSAQNSNFEKEWCQRHLDSTKNLGMQAY